MKKDLYYKVLSGVFSLILVLGIFTLPVWAADTGQVAATVTVQNLSITVSDGTVAYGTLSASATDDTTLNGTTHDSQTATNTSNIVANFNIQGADTASWALAGSPGSEIYAHSFCTSDCDGTPSWTALTTSYQTLATSVAAETGEQIFDLQIKTPTSTAVFTEQTANVTVQVVAP